MLTSHSAGGSAATSAPNGFDLDGFEKAGLRVVREFQRDGLIEGRNRRIAILDRGAPAVDGELPI
jgi:hypothetical protein